MLVRNGLPLVRLPLLLALKRLNWADRTAVWRFLNAATDAAESGFSM